MIFFFPEQILFFGNNSTQYLIFAYIIFYHCLASYHKMHYKASI